MKRLRLAVLALLLAPAALLAQSGVGGGGQSNVSGGGGGGPLTPSANFPANTSGVFTHTQQDPFLFSTNGNGNCSPNNIMTSGGVNSNNLVYNGLTGCVNGPSTNTLNNFSNGVAGLAQINDPGATGFNGWAGGVGVFGAALCAVGSHCHVWGGNFAAADTSGQAGANLIALENDLQVNNNSATGFGVIVAFQGNGQPTGDNFPAFAVTPPLGTGKVTSGFECKDATVSSGNVFTCVSIGKQTTPGSSNSQFVFWNANDGTTSLQAGVGLNGDHTFQFSAAFPTAVRAIAAYLTATATLSPNQLVKIDTANADSVVVCTTTDTSCHGFVAEAVATGPCLAAGTACPIITVPGSKASGILGTGTCAIGNNVIVDTTTNGRIKCTASQPAQGAWIGIAISAQVTVGNTVDILTKFQ